MIIRKIINKILDTILYIACFFLAMIHYRGISAILKAYEDAFPSLEKAFLEGMKKQKEGEEEIERACERCGRKGYRKDDGFCSSCDPWNYPDEIYEEGEKE